MTKPKTIAPHPAKFSDEIIVHLHELVASHGLTKQLVLDPFAGTGEKIEQLKVVPIKVELELPWAKQSKKRMVNGDSTHLPFPDNTFAGVITSPAYGNRMSDHHNAKEWHGVCKGTGCIDCNWTGQGKTQKRITYKHYLLSADHEISEKNTGIVAWGTKYRDLHAAVWAECTRVSKPGAMFLLNVSDHVRAGKVVNVTEWHLVALHRQGWRLVEQRRIETPRMRFGANSSLRVTFENVLVMELRNKEGI